MVFAKIEYYENGASLYKGDYREGEPTHLSGKGAISDDMQPIKTRVFESEIEYKKFSWCDSWKELSEKDQMIVWAMFGKDHLRDQYKNNFHNLKTPAKLLQNAFNNFYLLGWNKPCTRCGGSGSYSYCQMYGTMCFKCQGKKIQKTSPTLTELRRFLKKYPEGILYSEDMKSRAFKGKGQYLN